MRRSGFQRANKNRTPSRMSSTPPRIEPRACPPVLKRSSRGGMTLSGRHVLRNFQDSGDDQQEWPEFAEAVAAILRGEEYNAHCDDHDRPEERTDAAIGAGADRARG